MPEKTVAIIGSGIAGILSAKHALENDLLPFVFEKSNSIGGLWSLKSTFVWEGMIANASIYRQMFSDHPWPKNSNIFPTAKEINNYLMSYVKRFSLEKHIILNNKIEFIKKVEGKSQKWEIKSSDEMVRTFDFVIVATGEHAVPFIPNIENYKKFQGIQIHSSEFKQKDPRFKSKIVVVVGCAFNGIEISDRLVDHAKQVINIFRRPYLIIPKMLAYQKKGESDEIKPKIMQEHSIPWDLFFFRRAFDFSLLPNRQSQIEIYSDLFPRQTNRLLSHPSLFFDLHEPTQNIFITLSNDYMQNVQEKKILPIRSVIKSFEKNGIILTDGTLIECDVVIYCTGYHKNINEFVNLVQIDYDNLNFKSILGRKLFKQTFHPEIMNMAFVGLATGFLFPGIELQAKWATMVFSGKIKLPNRLDMINHINKNEEETNPFHLTLFYPNGNHLKLCDSIACEMDLLPDFDELKKTDPDSYDLLWNYAMCAPHYLFKKDKQFTLKIMNEIKSFETFN